MRGTTILVLVALLAGMLVFGMVSSSTDAASTPRPAILCPPAC
jgi:hypothetical protein